MCVCASVSVCEVEGVVQGLGGGGGAGGDGGGGGVGGGGGGGVGVRGGGGGHVHVCYILLEQPTTSTDDSCMCSTTTPPYGRLRLKTADRGLTILTEFREVSRPGHGGYRPQSDLPPPEISFESLSTEYANFTLYLEAKKY